ncbi:MAG: NAD(+) synthase [Burkholderiales bacterium]|nr:NAD(+) synthase [Burkholderiales bacterium]
MNDHAGFFDLNQQGFLRIAVATPRCRVADPAFNAEQTLALWQQADAQGAALALFPELGLSAYTCDDLFQQRALLDGCQAALQRLLHEGAGLACLAVVGMPLRVGHSLFNCAAVLQRGRLLGVVPKTYLPNYGEFYEARQFNPADHAPADSVTLCGQIVPFGSQLLFRASDRSDFAFHVEICEDLWVPIPPSSYAALAGATLLLNLSASNVTVGKSAYRHALAAAQSARCIAAYAYSSAGEGESTTDLAWDGQSLVCENGQLLAESARFAGGSQLICADVDLERLARERMRQTSFGQSAGRHAAALAGFRSVDFTLGTLAPQALRRHIERYPYVPADAARRDERCQEVYQIQVQGLTQRLRASGIDKLVIGISGGLDSTHALLICARAMDALGLPRTNILAVTMPGFATGTRTLDQAWRLMRAIGCEARQIDIRPSCEQMLKDIGHPFVQGQPQYDITFENVQAGERTSHLFRLANFHGALVVGTGDLSELALGWSTYGVGDHMSHYNVNASVPKTLIKHLVRWVAESPQALVPEPQVLLDILDTEISPELVPGDAAGQPGQSTESQIGPYDLHDFFLYYVLRFGFAPSKVAYLAHAAWHDASAGAWPEGPHVQRQAYDLDAIARHLRSFVWRFFKTSQFKRSCVPNAPKVGSGGSLSPRGDWRAPSDGEAEVWLHDLGRIPRIHDDPR